MKCGCGFVLDAWSSLFGSHQRAVWVGSGVVNHGDDLGQNSRVK